jgi:hypothetical protein
MGRNRTSVELQKVARPDIAAVIGDERAPGLAASTRRPYIPHVFLNGAFADANVQLQQLTANPFRIPEYIVCGYRLDVRDDFSARVASADNEVGTCVSRGS